jgi:hypothetical protein
VFPFPFKEGDPNTALDAPSTVVITETWSSTAAVQQTPFA